ncbi:phage tail spike protein [Gemella bergeri]
MIYLKNGNIPLNLAYEDIIVQEKNSTYQLSFKFPTNNHLWGSLVEETLLLADDLHGEQEFIIFEIEKHHAYITVYANQVATLLNNYSIGELSVNNASGDRVMRGLVSSIIREHKFTFSSDIAAMHSINLKNVTVATALFKDKHSILGEWGGDLIRDKYDIKLLSNGGTEKEALFMYKKNLKSYQQKKSIKDLRTRIHFTKTITSQNKGEEDKVIKVMVDSPLINKYKNIYEGNLEVNDQDVIDSTTLTKYGVNYFKTTLCDVIEESIEIDVVGKPDVPVKIFDTVTIFHEKFNLDVKKKITKYTFSPMSKKLKTIGFGKIQQGLGAALASMIDDAVTEKVETKVDAFKIQENFKKLLKLDKAELEEKMRILEEQSKGALEVKKALFEADSTIPKIVKTKILDAVEAEIGRLKTIITEAEMIKAIQAHLDYATIKNAIIDKAFIKEIISDETFRQEFEEGDVTTQNIFIKIRDRIQSNIRKNFLTKDETKKLVNDLVISEDGIRQITQEETAKIIKEKKSELKGDKGDPGKDGSSINRNFVRGSGNLSLDSGKWKDGTFRKSGKGNIEVVDIPDSPIPTIKKGFKILSTDGGVTQDEFQLTKGKWTVSWWVKGKKGQRVQIQTYWSALDTSSGVGFSTLTQDGWQLVSFTSEATKEGIYSISYIYLASGDPIIVTAPKLEQGNIATPWCPAYEDLQGKDGVLPNYNLISNTHFPNLAAARNVNNANLKLIENDYNGHNSIDVNISGLTEFKWKGFDMQSSISSFKKGDKVVIRLPIYIFYDVNLDSDIILSLKNHNKNKTFKTFNLSNGTVKNQWIVKKFSFIVENDFDFERKNWFYFYATKNGHFKVAEPYLGYGEEVPNFWLPSLEDLKGHSLIATAWYSGEYQNGFIKDVKIHLKVYYDGEVVKEGVKISIPELGEYGKNIPYKKDDVVIELLDGKNETGKSLYTLFEVEYNYLKATAEARLNNSTDPTVIEEVVIKNKQFESTLNNFVSTISQRTKILEGNDEIRKKSITDLYSKISQTNSEITSIVKKTTENELLPFNLFKSQSGTNDITFNLTENIKAGEVYTMAFNCDFESAQYMFPKMLQVKRLDDYSGDDILSNLTQYQIFVANRKKTIVRIKPDYDLSRIYMDNFGSAKNVKFKDIYILKGDKTNLFKTDLVSKSEVGTIIRQNSESVRIAWNNYSKYFQFEDESLTIYEGTKNEDKRRLRLDYTGTNFYDTNGQFSGGIRGYYKPVSWGAQADFYSGMNFLVKMNGRIGWFEEVEEWGKSYESPILSFNYISNDNDGNENKNKLVAGRKLVCENGLHIGDDVTVKGVQGDSGGLKGENTNVKVSGLTLKFRRGILVEVV